MYTFVTDGECFFTIQYNGDILDTATGLDSWLLAPPINYPYFCYFNRGATGLVDGATLTGGTSGAVIKVGHVVLTAGVLGSTSGGGILFFQKVSGEIISGETLTSSGTLAYSSSAALNSPMGIPPRALFLQTETNSIRFALGNAVPTNAADSGYASFGTILSATQNLMISGLQNIASFKVIHAASGSNATVNMEIYY